MYINNFFGIPAGSRVVVCRHTECLGSTYSKMYVFPKRRFYTLPFELFLSFSTWQAHPGTDNPVQSALAVLT